MSFTVSVVKVKGHYHWAIKAVVNGESRYRGYYYKADAVNGLIEWEYYHKSPLSESCFVDREFHHNFNSAEELRISEV